MLEKVIIDGKINALIIRKGTDVKTSTFFSPSDLFMQISIFKREAGFIEAPHYHKQVIRKVNRVEQFLYLLSGEMKVFFYDKKKKLNKTRTVKKGDGLLLISGTHGLKMIKTCKAISVKQGPFLGDKDDKINIKVKE